MLRVEFRPEDGNKTETCSGYWIKYSNQCCVRRKPWTWPSTRNRMQTTNFKYVEQLNIYLSVANYVCVLLQKSFGFVCLTSLHDLISWLAAWQSAVPPSYVKAEALFPFYQSLKLTTRHEQPWYSLTLCVVSNRKLTLMDVRTLREGRPTRMRWASRDHLRSLLLVYWFFFCSSK
jgi:hypothetical protein